MRHWKRSMTHGSILFAAVHLLCTAFVATVRPRQSLASGPILLVHVLGATMYIATLIVVFRGGDSKNASKNAVPQGQPPDDDPAPSAPNPPNGD